ncbi:MAG TPA: transcriptional regulator [Firmicutes bacterium]|nr:transcriptional regulator [Bacillota bacterium]
MTALEGACARECEGLLREGSGERAGERAGERWAIGVDLGGTKVAVAAVSSAGRLAGRNETRTLKGVPPEESLAAMVQLAEQAVCDAGIERTAISGVGVGAPGPLNSATGIIHFAPNLGWENVAIGPYFARNFPGIPVKLENDANAAALGEYRFGAGRGLRHMVYITVSTGVGGGLILDGKLYTGASGGAGEIGHIPVQREGGPRCGCGHYGCLEAVSSGTAIARMAREHVASGGGGLLAEMAQAQAQGRVGAAAVGAAARLGDPAASAILKTAFTYLGGAMATVVNLLNPEAIIVGGGVSALWDLMLPYLQHEIDSGSVAGFQNKVQIRRAELGRDTGIYGAGALFV